jgi:hypothetical protein
MKLITYPFPVFDPHPGKKDPFIRIPAEFTGSGLAELRGEKSLISRAFGSRYARGFPVVFQQTGQILGVFSTGLETDDFTGFSDSIRDSLMGKGAQFRLISPYVRPPSG